ncbi:hypothetical protein J7E86_13425 [Streptomyces sp. ISL-11]|nr:hypothetical protein [Streptomyces sp. ISL-11]
MWIPQRSLRDLQNILIGYATALSVHGVDERFALSPDGPFAEWLRARYGWSMALGWAEAIDRNAGDEEPLTAFFRLLDEYRSACDPHG